MADPKTQIARDAIAALEKALNIELPSDCEIEVNIRDFKAKGGQSQVIKAVLSRESGVAKKFDVKRLVGAMSEAHRT